MLDIRPGGAWRWVSALAITIRIPAFWGESGGESGHVRALELLTKLLSTENVSHQGRYWTLPETTTLPRPITKPHPQFWRATSTVPTMAWSLERGIKVITGGTASSMDRIINNWYLFQDAVETAG